MVRRSRSSLSSACSLTGALFLFGLGACSVGDPIPDGGSPRDVGSCGVEGEVTCVGREVRRCTQGALAVVDNCVAPDVCAPGLGCRTCLPGDGACREQTRLRCNADGTGYDEVDTCASNEACRTRRAGPEAADAECYDACTESTTRSNIGCEYYAVDLDQPFFTRPIDGMTLDAQSEQFAVVISNPWTEVRANVVIEVNDAPVGQPPVTRTVFEGSLVPGEVRRVDLPQREVDGRMGSTPGVGTQLTSNAYRIQSSYPIVAYQFNAIVAQQSNDASLLIPTSGIDSFYRVLGYPAADPNIAPGLGNVDGNIARAFLTIVGATDDTEITITTPIATQTGGGIEGVAAGGTITATLDRFDVLNVESSELAGGDFTGATVQANHPVVVFTGTERSGAPVAATVSNLPVPPQGLPMSLCCQDHLEDQVFPASAWGQRYLVPHSPTRNTLGWTEPDIVRIMADRETTTVHTSLGGADAMFTLEPGEYRELYPRESISVYGDRPLVVAQIMVSQSFVPSMRDDMGNASASDPNGGDPSLTYIGASEQFRARYAFLTPNTFDRDFAVITAPLQAQITLDGRMLSNENDVDCTRETLREVDAIPAGDGGLGPMSYIVWTCSIGDGAHTLDASVPVGLLVYGNQPAGSYAYVGGSELERINLF